VLTAPRGKGKLREEGKKRGRGKKREAPRPHVFSLATVNSMDRGGKSIGGKKGGEKEGKRPSCLRACSALAYANSQAFS